MNVWPGVGVDRDPAPRAGCSPGGEIARDERGAEQAAGGQRVADRARAVIPVGDERRVSAAPDVGEVGDRVAAGDHALHGFGHVRRDRDRAVPADREPSRHRRERAPARRPFPGLGLFLFAQLLANFGVGRRARRDRGFARHARRGGRAVMHRRRHGKALGFFGVAPPRAPRRRRSRPTPMPTPPRRDRRVAAATSGAAAPPELALFAPAADDPCPPAPAGSPTCASPQPATASAAARQPSTAAIFGALILRRLASVPSSSRRLAVRPPHLRARSHPPTRLANLSGCTTTPPSWTSHAQAPRRPWRSVRTPASCTGCAVPPTGCS